MKRKSYKSQVITASREREREKPRSQNKKNLRNRIVTDAILKKNKRV